MAILKAVFGTACALAVVAAAVPVQAFDDPLSRQTAEPLPNDVDRQLYCAEVLAQEAHVLTGEGVRRFQMRMAASHLLGILGRDLLAKAAATIDDGSEDYVAAVAGVASEAGADWQAGTLRHSAADCLALARSVEKLGASAEVDGLVSCSQLFYMRAKELVEAGDWAGEAAASALSTAVDVKALDVFQASGLTFMEALDALERNSLLQQIALGENPAAVPEEQCRALAQP